MTHQLRIFKSASFNNRQSHIRPLPDYAFSQPTTEPPSTRHSYAQQRTVYAEATFPLSPPPPFRDSGILPRTTSPRKKQSRSRLWQNIAETTYTIKIRNNIQLYQYSSCPHIPAVIITFGRRRDANAPTPCMNKLKLSRSLIHSRHDAYVTHRPARPCTRKKHQIALLQIPTVVNLHAFKELRTRSPRQLYVQ